MIPTKLDPWIAHLLPAWLTGDTAEKWLNSAFFTSFIGALAGAWAGAYAAQKIAERVKTEELLSNQMRDINAALMASFDICNAMIAFKRQFLAPLRDAYLKAQADHEAHVKSQSTAPFRLLFNFNTSPIPEMPVDRLSIFLSDKLVIVGRAASALNSLKAALVLLQQAVAIRHSLADAARTMTPEERRLLPAKYLGFKQGPFQDTSYADAMEAQWVSTQSLIFFSHLIIRDLREVAQDLLKKNARAARRLGLTEVKPSFDEAIKNQWIPPDAEFEGWLRGFAKEPPKKRGLAAWIEAVRERVRRDVGAGRVSAPS